MVTISIGFAYDLHDFWEEWNIRIFVLLSQFLQLMLYFLMPHRKCISNALILLLINTTYVVIFIAAGTALAYISSGMPDRNGYQPPLVLWASFMLLHLAGVGQTIAQTVDDSKMWYKRFFSFLYKDLVIFLIICLQWRQVAVPGGWGLMATVACVGACIQMKLLWLGKSDSRVKRFVPRNPTGDGQRLRRSMVGVEAPDAPASGRKEITEARRQLREFDLVSKAFKYYHDLRKLIPGLSLTASERKRSRLDFLRLDDPGDAVRIVEIELNLAYDAYFTNGFDPPKNKDRRGLYLFLRLTYHTCALVLFTTIGIQISFLSPSDLEGRYNSRDRLITRLLCFSTVLLNFLALLKFLFSDYVIASWSLKRLTLLPQNCRRWSSANPPNHDVPTTRRNTNFVLSYLTPLARVFFRRWSETVSRLSFMIECLREATMESTRLPNIFLQRYLTPPTSDTQWYDDEVGEFIFTHLQTKARSSESEDVAREIFESKGDWVLLKKQTQPTAYESDLHLPDLFLHSPYDLRLLLWHIATEILYYTSPHQEGNDPSIDQCRKMSNLLSEYMMYLTFKRRRIMSGLRGNFIVRYHRIISYFKDNRELVKRYKSRKMSPQRLIHKFHQNIVDEYRKDGVIREPVILQAVKIAKELRKKLKKKEMWEVVSEVWVEMLVYAATHCDPIAHVQRLAGGGELITIVWLLSAHLGFGRYFLPQLEEEGEAPA